jgi:hypothetical protein
MAAVLGIGISTTYVVLVVCCYDTLREHIFSVFPTVVVKILFPFSIEALCNYFQGNLSDLLEYIADNPRPKRKVKHKNHPT